MDFKRIFFTTISVISTFIAFIISYYLQPKLISLILGPILIFSIYALFQMISVLIIALFRESGLPDIDEYCYFVFGMLLINQKRIYYSDLGYFYMSGKSRLTIWKQGYFISRKLFSVYYTGDIDGTRSKIKSELERIYALELEENRKRKLLKDWNGYLDKKSERDDKLNKILE